MTSTKEKEDGPWKLVVETTHHSDASQDEYKYKISVIHLPTGKTVKTLTGSDVETKFGEFGSGYKRPELVRSKKDGKDMVQLKVLTCKSGDSEVFTLKEPG
eukprot:Skav229598  [mRNA]  locus=scaffold510:205558:205860:+ [translate_table: standard]